MQKIKNEKEKIRLLPKALPWPATTPAPPTTLASRPARLPAPSLAAERAT
jgi:hypothetical protein